MFVDRSLARRIEACSTQRSVEYARAYARLHPNAGSEVLPLGGGYAVFVDAASPVNRALGLGMDGPLSPDGLQSAEDFFRARGVIPRVEVCPLADDSLLEAVAVHGFTLGYFFSVLARPVGAVETVIASPNGVAVTRAEAEQAGLFLNVVARGFSELEMPPQEDLDILAPNFYSATSASFLAWIDGQPVGGASMAVHAGVAEMGGASTLPAYRRRGVQTALLAARLAECRRLGVDLAVALTDPGSPSQSNIMRAGFEMAYTKLVMRAL